MNSIGSSEDSPSSLEARDYIFTTMQQQARSASALPDMLPASSTDIRCNAANIAIFSGAQTQDVTPEMVKTVFNGLNSSSGYIRDKAQQALQEVLQQPTLSRACADAAAAGMHSIIAYFAKNSPSVTKPTPQAPVVGPPAIPTPASPAANNYSSSNQSIQQLPPLAAWALDMLLTVAHVNEDAFLGCMMGSAVGDMLGLPIEGNSSKLCQQYVADVVLPVKTTNYHRHGWTFGQYSDDTQQSRETYLTVLQGRGRMDAQLYALRTALLFQPGAYRVMGYGKTSATAMQAIWAGAHYTEAGVKSGNGNGSAMRSACLGVLLSGTSKEELVQTARAMSSITHASSGPMDAAAAVTLAARYASATRNLPLQPEHFIKYIVSGVAAGNPKSKLPPFLRELLLLRHLSLEEAAARITEIGTKENKERIWRDAQPGVNCISVGAWQTTLWALWCFLTNTDSYIG
ncbi:hypothetical protein OEZ86_013753 [Tetradesmus obliquus]|nr:hypothetical protein OEZ86_013753 [Tetradesmus obliquus]